MCIRDSYKSVALVVGLLALARVLTQVLAASIFAQQVLAQALRELLLLVLLAQPNQALAHSQALAWPPNQKLQ